MKKIIVLLVIITIMSAIGYALLFYGGHKSEAESSRNLYLILGEILMWPWFFVNFIQKYITLKHGIIEQSIFWIAQYLGYFLLFYFVGKIKNRYQTEDDKSI